MSKPASAPTWDYGWSRRAARLATFLRHNPGTLVGLVIVGIVCILMVVGSAIAPYDPLTPDPTAILQGPSWSHPFGTDIDGFDILSRVMSAPRVDMSIALLGTALGVAIGTPLGVISGYARGAAGDAIVRLSDLIQAFPLFILAMALVAAMGHNVENLVLVLAFLGAPTYVRLMRTQALALSKRSFVEASVVTGNDPVYTLRRHILPNAITPVFIQTSVSIGFAILLVAGLSFIGAGVQDPTAEWGLMIANGAPNIITGQWWPSVFPGIAIAVTVVGFGLVGEGLQRFYAQRTS